MLNVGNTRNGEFNMSNAAAQTTANMTVTMVIRGNRRLFTVVRNSGDRVRSVQALRTLFPGTLLAHALKVVDGLTAFVCEDDLLESFVCQQMRLLEERGFILKPSYTIADCYMVGSDTDRLRQFRSFAFGLMTVAGGVDSDTVPESLTDSAMMDAISKIFIELRLGVGKAEAEAAELREQFCATAKALDHLTEVSVETVTKLREENHQLSEKLSNHS